MSFAAPKDAADLDVLNRQPTSFLLPAQAVDQLRAAAGTIISVPPDFQRLLKEAGVKIVPDAARP